MGHGAQWQFWTGNAGGGDDWHKRYARLRDEYAAEDSQLLARIPQVEEIGRRAQEALGIGFIKVERFHLPGDAPRRQKLDPRPIPEAPKRGFSLGFHLASAGIAGWKAAERIPKVLGGIPMSGQLKHGWSIWVEETDLLRRLEVLQNTQAAAAEQDNLAVERGCLLKFGGSYRRSGASNNADYWVVGVDGTLRAPDELSERRGTKNWLAVEPVELAISWHGSTTCKVAHMPANGLTPAQLAAVRQIETEDLRVNPGFFGLDPQINQEHEALETAVAAALPHCLVCKEALPWQGRAVELLEQGAALACEGRGVERFVDWAKGFAERVGTREAQIVWQAALGQGGEGKEVQLLVASSTSGKTLWMVARVRPLPEGAMPPAAPAPIQQEEAQRPATAADMAGLLAKWGPPTKK